VRERRGARLKGDDDTLVQRRILTGRRASSRLIDGIGDLPPVMRARFGGEGAFPRRRARDSAGCAAARSSGAGRVARSLLPQPRNAAVGAFGL